MESSKVNGFVYFVCFKSDQGLGNAEVWNQDELASIDDIGAIQSDISVQLNRKDVIILNFIILRREEREINLRKE